MERIKKYYLRNRKRLIIAVSVLLLAISLVSIYFVLNVNIVSNDECLWVTKRTGPEKTTIFFKFVKVDGVSWNAGIRNGDKLLAINDVAVTNGITAQGILNRVTPGNYAKYLIEKNGKILTVFVLIKKFFSFPHLALGLIGFFWLLIGFIVLTAKPDGIVQKLFYGIGATSVLASMAVLLQTLFFLPEFHFKGLMLLLLCYMWTLSYSYLPFLTIYFFWNFPKPFKLLERKWIKTLIFLIPGIICILSFLAMFASFMSRRDILPVFEGIAVFLHFMFFLGNLIAYISLIISYRHLKTSEEKKPIRIILGAFSLALLAAIYTAVIAPAITDTVFNSPEFYAPVILIIVFPLAFAYAIFKYQLLDVSLVVKNTIIYGSATLSVAAIYFFAIYVIGQELSKIITGAEEYQGIIAAVLFIIFALVFQSTKDKFQDFITAKFYPEQFAYQKVLVKFSNEVPTLVGMEKILDSMKETFVNALLLKTFGILIKDPGTGNYILARSIGITHPGFSIEAEKSTVISPLIKHIQTRSFASENAAIDQQDFITAFPENAQQLIRENIYTIIPMVINTKIVGFLLFGLKHSGSQFAGKDLELLSAVASQAAIAIENARLYKTEAEKNKIERDLELARRIQQGLLPKCIPDISGLDICGEMIPAMQVGGDYFDLIIIEKSKLFVVVGDVSGKGLSASLYMTKLQTMIQLACTPGKSPKEILIEINKRFYESIERNWFVTMTLALFDMENRTVKFCRAGHMPVLFATNGTVQSYRTQGIGIGLEKGLIFEKTLVEEEIQIKSGNLFAFFSDGITEAMNESEEMFGEDKLYGMLKNTGGKRSGDIMNDIWNSVKVFRGRAEQNDDMTMVLVKVNL
ncbi:MAG TPA: SpoIIE family protein phosphatase [Ignavibacteriaceae bacterium]|nr:SpoIIE family protein phosphatase [Ignavibacteriaceae bacterium]